VSGGEADPLLGRVVGRHVLEARLGSGAFGQVYRARHRVLERAHAVKVLKEEYAADKRAVQLFVREARLAAALQHPNIVIVHEADEQDNLPYIAMDLLEGKSLREVLNTNGALSEERALLLLRQLGQALDFAHDQGVVHRDIKPENAIISPSDHLTLVDFGIARAREVSTVTANGTGTVHYMAPEMLGVAADDTVGDFEIGLSADRYALGIVAFELLCGRLPFDGLSAREITRSHLHQTPPSLRTYRPELPEAVDQVVIRQLAKEPAGRFETCSTFVAALAAAIQPPAPPPPRSTSPTTESWVGPYILRELLGRHDVVATFRADHRMLHVTRVLKLLLLEQFAPDYSRIRQRFVHSTSLAIGLQHPNIVRTLDLSQDGDVLYVTMEPLEGRMLSTLLREQLPLTRARVAGIISQLASALDYLAARGLVHRDVNPSNVFIDPLNHVTLLGFETATAIAQPLEKNDLIFGMPGYIPPEMIEGGSVSPEIDRWALGVIAYVLLTNHRPFPAPDHPLEVSPQQAPLAAIGDDPILPSSLQPSLPRAVDAVLLRQLGENASDRFPSAVAFAEALTAAVHTRANHGRVTVAAGLSIEVGQFVAGNEDSVLCEPPESLLVDERGLFCAVADGMGGGRAGGIASSMAVTITRDWFYESSGDDAAASLRTAISQANAAVYDAGAGMAGRDQMVSSLTAAVLSTGGVVLGHVGNTRCYIVRRGAISQLTPDCSELLTEEPTRAVRGLGLQPEIEIDVCRADLDAGSSVIICSDGLYGLVTDAEILTYVTRLRPADAVEALVRRARSCGSPDNISVMVARLSGAGIGDATTDRPSR
jgi:serine/threonine protein kinase/serine/threonine protein phosphatase PrpC